MRNPLTAPLRQIIEATEHRDTQHSDIDPWKVLKTLSALRLKDPLLIAEEFRLADILSWMPPEVLGAEIPIDSHASQIRANLELNIIIRVETSPSRYGVLQILLDLKPELLVAKLDKGQVEVWADNFVRQVHLVIRRSVL